MQKLELNHGFNYVSTSHADVFEVCKDKQQKQENQYLQSEKSEDQDEDVRKQQFIRPDSKPWQLKTVYQVVEKQDVFSDSEDEDAVVFEPQPYETIKNIGYRDMLGHLKTQDLTRRSNIIVSSTLSITVAPMSQ